MALDVFLNKATFGRLFVIIAIFISLSLLTAKIKYYAKISKTFLNYYNSPGCGIACLIHTTNYMMSSAPAMLPNIKEGVLFKTLEVRLNGIYQVQAQVWEVEIYLEFQLPISCTLKLHMPCRGHSVVLICGEL